MDDRAGAPDAAAAERRRLQECAFGRSSDESARRAALEALAALGPPHASMPPSRGVVPPPTARGAFAAETGGTATSSTGADRADHAEHSAVSSDEPTTRPSEFATRPDGSSSRPSESTPPAGDPAGGDPAGGDAVAASQLTAQKRRRRLLIVVAIVVAAVVALLAGRALFSASDGVYSREQVAADQSTPEWLIAAFDAVEGRMADPGLAERLAESVRRVEGGGLVGYVFRDAGSSTICLAGSRGIDCAGTADYPGDGLILTMIDPRNPEQHALRYELLPDTGFRGAILDLDRPATQQQMDASRWPDLIVGCLADRGFSATADPGGEIEMAPVDAERALRQQLALVHCDNRFPLRGQYLTVEP